MKKFELTSEQKTIWPEKTLYRIRACINFTTTSGVEINAGDLGGFVEKESNLSQEGKAWIHGNAEVYGDARVFDNAVVSGNAVVCDNAEVSGEAWVYNNAEVSGDARVYGNAVVSGNAKVYGRAEVNDNAEVFGNAEVYGNARVLGEAKVYGRADISDVKHIFCVGVFGKEAKALTLFRTKNLETKIAFSGGAYAVSEFEEMMKKAEWDDDFVSVAKSVIEVAKKRTERFANCDKTEEKIASPRHKQKAKYNPTIK